ncbi:MAG TPA: hypothetical protein VGG33_06600 [Polyangia bacterium]
MFRTRPHDRLPAPRRARRAVTGGWVLLAALLSLLAQGTGIAHLALVSHVQCYEHDALAHANDIAPAHTPPDAAAPVVAVASGAPSEAGHADDHCLAAGLRQRDVVLEAPEFTRTPAVAAVDVPSPLAGQAPLPASVPLILLAPKSSPPAQV